MCLYPVNLEIKDTHTDTLTLGLESFWLCRHLARDFQFDRGQIRKLQVLELRQYVYTMLG